jgi:hypothetical protein
MNNELIMRIENCHSAMDLYKMKDEILEALIGAPKEEPRKKKGDK